MIENKLLTKGGIRFRYLFFKIACIAILVSFHGDVWSQELDQNKNEIENSDFTLDIYRRESEKFRLPNVFVRLNKHEEHCVQLQLIFSEDGRIVLELDSKTLCGKNISIGRNHMDQSILKYWSHHTPQLYSLNILATDSQKVLYDGKFQVGIVDYRIENDELLINNKSDILKSLIICDSIKDNDIEIFKKHHVNTLIFNYMPTSDLLYAADELGLYVILDLRDLDQSKLSHDLIRLKNQTSISCFITENESINEFLKDNFPHTPIRTTFPKNLLEFSLKENSLQKIRQHYQPFEIAIDPICSNEQEGLLISIRGTEDFKDWENTQLICEVSNSLIGYFETLTLIPQKNPEIFFKVPCHFSQLSEYKVTLITRQAFSIFNITDTVSYFENKHK